MKLFKNILFATFALVLAGAVSCEQVEEGAGDATIGFADPTYVYKESAGRVKLPVKFTGEPKTWPITFDVVATSEDGEVEDLVHFTQTAGLKYVGNPDAPAYIEFDIRDNEEINDSRYISLAFANVKGATVEGEGKTVIELADNDNNPYERLWGNWNVTADGGASSFTVNISGGFTEEDVAKNADKKLVCFGFGGYAEDLSSYGGAYLPLKQPVWYLKYDAEAQMLSTVPGELMANIWSFGTGSSEELVKMATGTLTADGNVATDIVTPVTATWSDDMNTITFDPNYLLVAGVWGDGTYLGYWLAFSQVVMTRAK